jgi:hypothetical protein
MSGASSVRVKRGGLEREFKPPNTGAVAGRINELAAGVVMAKIEKSSHKPLC